MSIVHKRWFKPVVLGAVSVGIVVATFVFLLP